ncbi:FliH/SctL family protein [Helicovermis profundi]|uniref:Flagellar assembly protein FliH/Type III secretion system HrpE domain-containing protein n=1 Tax=Helicovermis profundi TaxID=3065157 RepID=A0AAU9ESF1_9FIRM|nr:hypothetical protein HLPR_17110 [Clostridia bacterium S502]
MSKVFKASRVVLDNKKYKLADDIIITNQEIISSFDLTSTQKPGVENDDDIVEKTRKDTENYMDQLVQESKEKIKEAENEYNNIIEKAYDDSKAILEKSKIEGFNIGKEQGLEKARTEMIEIISEINKNKETSINKYNKIISDSEEDIVNLVISIVDKIMNRIIDTDDSYLIEIVKKAIEKTSYKGIVTLKVFSDDYINALTIKDKIISNYEDVDDILIKEDSSLTKGSCIIETSYGSVDSGIWTQFEKLKLEFLDLLRSE